MASLPLLGRARAWADPGCDVPSGAGLTYLVGYPVGQPDLVALKPNEDACPCRTCAPYYAACEREARILFTGPTTFMIKLPDVERFRVRGQPLFRLTSRSHP